MSEASLKDFKKSLRGFKVYVIFGACFAMLCLWAMDEIDEVIGKAVFGLVALAILAVGFMLRQRLIKKYKMLKNLRDRK